MRLAPGADFAHSRVREVSVELRYVDAAHGLDVADRIVLASPEAHDTFEYDYVDPARSDYEFKVVTTFTNNLTRIRDWAPGGDAELLIGLG